MRQTSSAEARFLQRMAVLDDSVEQALELCSLVSEMTGAKLSCFFRIPVKKKNPKWAYLVSKTGSGDVQERIAVEEIDAEALLSGSLSVVQNTKGGPFPEILCAPGMKSGIAIMLQLDSLKGLLLVNHDSPYHFSLQEIQFIEALASLLNLYEKGKPE